MTWNRATSQQEIWYREDGLALLQVKRMYDHIRWEIFLGEDETGKPDYWGKARYIKTAQAAAERCWSVERNHR